MRDIIETLTHLPHITECASTQEQLLRASLNFIIAVFHQHPSLSVVSAPAPMSVIVCVTQRMLTETPVPGVFLALLCLFMPSAQKLKAKVKLMHMSESVVHCRGVVA